MRAPTVFQAVFLSVEAFLFPTVFQAEVKVWERVNLSFIEKQLENLELE